MMVEFLIVVEMLVFVVGVGEGLVVVLEWVGVLCCGELFDELCCMMVEVCVGVLLV